jgi:hypothetical protein
MFARNAEVPALENRPVAVPIDVYLCLDFCETRRIRGQDFDHVSLIGIRS